MIAQDFPDLRVVDGGSLGKRDFDPARDAVDDDIECRNDRRSSPPLSNREIVRDSNARDLDCDAHVEFSVGGVSDPTEALAEEVVNTSSALVAGPIQEAA